MELLTPPITRWTAELADRDQERRFRIYDLSGQRRTTLTTLAVILLADVLMSAYSWVGAEGAMSLGRSMPRIAVMAVGVVVVMGLWKARQHQWLRCWVAGAAAVFIGLMVVIIATGINMGFRGTILVIGGVVIVYLTVPLNLLGVTAFGLLFTAVTFPVWIAIVDSDTVVEVAYTFMATMLAHALSFVEARRRQRERRVLFAQRETLLGLSTVDPLTTLMNRRAVDAELDAAWWQWRRTGAPLSVLMADLDHFKMLNDSQGHSAGDRALRLVADAIGGAIPVVPGQVAARYGGEEFICILPGLDAAEASVVAGNILAEVRRIAIPHASNGGAGSILTLSIGVAMADSQMGEARELIDAADRQLYRAKSEGRNCARAASMDVVGPTA